MNNVVYVKANEYKRPFLGACRNMTDGVNDVVWRVNVGSRL